ncbi:Clavaminate synthase-like protein [Epithele typhae]|uniref:Clavaminate synthase-like protein n=1 Tax=Epithele typhae TaxID=378194 RepID=UPI0020089DFD|nr:Clavaminate synthase-like protein [Epithele typhae]KAH9934556.1 Clavaminate synthase-like protein [Epithele typhae]
MPATTLPAIPHFIPASPTQESLEWADLPIIDLYKAGTEEGLAELTSVARDAMHTHGFMYIVNHGLSQAQNDRIVDIADVPFSQVSENEKKLYASNMKETGKCGGYKPREYWHIDNGVRDQIDNIHMYRSVDGLQEYPKALHPLLPEIRAFCEHNHYKILHPILRLLARGMELPEDTFVNMHNFEALGETGVRFIKYYPRSEEDEVKAKNVWLKGHTDIGSITILWSQPVSGLQILSPDGKWRWVKHTDNALVVNVGDALEMLSGGFYKATIHRVVQPPADQRTALRLGTFYFALTDEVVKLSPLIESPVLNRPGAEVKRRCADADAPTMSEWRQARVLAYGQTVLTKGEGNVEEEVLNGLVVKHYN